MQFTILLQSCRIHLLLTSYIKMAMQSECTLSGLYLFLYKVIILQYVDRNLYKNGIFVFKEKQFKLII